MKPKKPNPNCRTCGGFGFTSVVVEGYRKAKPCKCTIPPRTEAVKQREQIVGARVLDAILMQGSIRETPRQVSDPQPDLFQENE